MDTADDVTDVSMSLDISDYKKNPPTTEDDRYKDDLQARGSKLEDSPPTLESDSLEKSPEVGRE